MGMAKLPHIKANPVRAHILHEGKKMAVMRDPRVKKTMM